MKSNRVIEENPLVSVVLITYQSSKTVLETLESIYSQTYSNLELVISDDGSSDSTIDICEKWIIENSERFYSVILVKSKINTGTSGNLNRGISKCKGIWVKPIAGDDKLLPSCIKDNVDYIMHNQDADIVFSRVILFGNDYLREDNKNLFKYDYFMLPYDKFYKKLIQRNFLPGPTAFIRTSIYKRVGLYDESIPLLEDWPFWMKACKEGCKFSFNNVETVIYRVQGSVSITSSKSQRYNASEDAAYKLSFCYQRDVSLGLCLFSIIRRYKYVLERYIKNTLINF